MFCISHPVYPVLASAEEEKNENIFYCCITPCLFIHFVVSVDETLGHEALLSLQLLIDQSSGA